MKLQNLKYIIIHCADTDQDIGVKEITKWHKKRGFDTIGYHYVVRRSGLVEKGRSENLVGAHCERYNRYSIGVCGVWRKKATMPCLFSIRELIEELKTRYPKAEIRPHSWFPTAKRQGKTCPNINLSLIVRADLLPK